MGNGRLDEGEVERRRALEQRGTGAEHDGMHGQPVFVDEPLPDQGLGDEVPP